MHSGHRRVLDDEVAISATTDDHGHGGEGQSEHRVAPAAPGPGCPWSMGCSPGSQPFAEIGNEAREVVAVAGAESLVDAADKGVVRKTALDGGFAQDSHRALPLCV